MASILGYPGTAVAASSGKILTVAIRTGSAAHIAAVDDARCSQAARAQNGLLVIQLNAKECGSAVGLLSGHVPRGYDSRGPLSPLFTDILLHGTMDVLQRAVPLLNAADVIKLQAVGTL